MRSQKPDEHKSSDPSSRILIAISAAAGLALIPACRGPSQPASVNLTSSEEACLDGGSLCYSNQLDTIKLVDDSGALTDFRGQTWGIAWGNANGNEWPDLYINHHKDSNTRGRFPTSHLVLDLGKVTSTRNFLTTGFGDQHSAIFHDFDGDNKDEILETIGGRSGTALPTNSRASNQVHKLDRPNKYLNIASTLGVEQAGARGRQAVPFVKQNSLHIAFLNQKRKDKKYGPNIMKRGATGIFTESPIYTSECPSPECKPRKLSLKAYKSLNYGLIDNDNDGDLVLCRSNEHPHIQVLVQQTNGIFLNAKNQLDGTPRFCLPAFFPSANKNLIAAETEGGIYLLAYDAETNNTRILHKFPLIQGLESKDMAIHDVNNDGLPDIISLQQPKNGQRTSTSLAMYLSQPYGCNINKPFSCYQPKSLDILNAASPRNFSVSDFNNDGSLDFLIGAGKTKPGPYKGGRYILISGKSAGKWLSVDLRCPNGTNAIGAVVSLSTNSSKIQKIKTSGTRHETQDDARLHFGLGNIQADHALVEVLWANGRKTTLEKQKLNRNIVINGKGNCDQK